jgi:hypothetical protein
MPFTAKQKLDFIKKICDAIKEGATLQSACQAAGTNQVTFLKWRRKYPKVEECYRAAQNEWYQYKRERLKFKAYSSLEKLVEGYEVEDVEEEFEVKTDAQGNETMKITKRKVKKRHIQPNPTATIFAISNLDSDNFSRTDKDKSDKQQDSAVNHSERRRILDEKLKEIAERHPNIKNLDDNE